MYINTNEEGRNRCIRPRADLRLADTSPQRLRRGRIVTDRMRIQSLKNVRIEGTTEICSTMVGYSKIHERGVVWCGVLVLTAVGRWRGIIVRGSRRVPYDETTTEVQEVHMYV